MGAIILFNSERMDFSPDQEIKSLQKLFIGRFCEAKIRGLSGGVLPCVAKASRKIDADIADDSPWNRTAPAVLKGKGLLARIKSALFG